MKILLVGAGGYAARYVNALLALSDPQITLEGIVEPYFSTCATRAEIDAAGIPVFDTMDAFYRQHTADLAIISTPSFLHKEQSLCALRHGSYVLCEKPVAPTVAEAEEMQEAEKAYGKWIAIGYQWSFSTAIQRLKTDVLSGVFGAPISLKTAISWPRTLDYYGRGTKWAGRLFKDGIPILDSIASNACAHYLHNMLFLLGDRPDRSAEVSQLSGECFRANDIESFDTCILKMKTASGVPLYFAASHATETRRDPEFEYTFENARVIYSKDDEPYIKAVFDDGQKICYGDPFENDFKKLLDCIDAIRKGESPICTVTTALPHTRLIQKIYEELPITPFPRELIRFHEAENRIFVEGLFEKMYNAYASESLIGG